jgi:hypothetical protein
MTPGSARRPVDMRDCGTRPSGRIRYPGAGRPRRWITWGPCSTRPLTTLGAWRDAHRGRPAYGSRMRRLPVLLAIVLVALAQPVARAAEPTCEALVAALPASLATAAEVVVAVTLEQGGREVAFERSRITRDAEGNVSTTVLERRGWRRPDGVQGGGGGGTAELALPCDDHDLAVTPDGDVELRLRDRTRTRPSAPGRCASVGRVSGGCRSSWSRRSRSGCCSSRCAAAS